MLEKYRKLAHDAHLNGDRVTAEYYLQFADHYFRVIADTRVRQEESRGRRDERWGENGEGAPRDDADDGNDFSVEADFPAFDQPPVYTRRDREDRAPERSSERAPERAPERSGEYRRRDERGPRDNGNRDDPRDNGAGETGGFDGDQGDGEDMSGNSRASEPGLISPSNNPFVRDSRGPRPARPIREDRRPRREDRVDERVPSERVPPERAGGERVVSERAAPPRRQETPAPVSVGLDPSLLPPAISASRRDADGDDEAAPVAAPRRRAPRRKPVEDSSETLNTLD